MTTLKLVFALFALATACSALEASDDYTFEQFKNDFGKRYTSSVEHARRKQLFESRLKAVLEHNRDADRSRSWKKGINQFSDLDDDEFRATRLGLHRATARARAVAADAGNKVSAAQCVAEGSSCLDASSQCCEGLLCQPIAGTKGAAPRATCAALGKVAPADRVDWRDHGVISAVKDQGECGSCWAFATTETVESYGAIATGQLHVLSPQQLVSCAPNPLQCGGVGGCRGSIPEVAFDYIQLHGFTSEWRYPYVSGYAEPGKDLKCSYNDTDSLVVISGYRKLPSNDYDAVVSALNTIGPLAVNVQANTWRDYESGVYTGCSNSSDIEIDHVVQLVGYGTDPKLGAYFTIRNSWDTTWGEAGYMRMYRPASAEQVACGTDPVPLDGTGCAGGAPTQHVCGTCGVLFDASYPVGARAGHPDGAQ